MVDGYIETTAKRSCMASCGCGTLIVGERIGWNPRTKRTLCSHCLSVARRRGGYRRHQVFLVGMRLDDE